MKIKASKFDKLWLAEVYKDINANKRPSYRVLRARLHKSLPEDYNPDEMDERLSRYKGEEIMLLGVDLVDPKLNVLPKADKIMRTIKEILLNESERKVIEAAEIAESSKIASREVSLILRLIGPYGKFWYSAMGSQEMNYGYGSVNIEHDNAIFDQYLYFKDIQSAIAKFYSPKEKRRAAKTESKDVGVLSGATTVNPIFKSKIDRIDPSLGFVLMPFNETWSNEIYRQIKATIESLDLQCLRADNLKGPIIIEDIWTKINSAAFIIADVTNRNANVMYEVGIAHTVGRPTILLTQNVKEIPFDFAHLRHLEYRNSMGKANDFRKRLRDAITSLYQEEQIDSPSGLDTFIQHSGTLFR